MAMGRQKGDKGEYKVPCGIHLDDTNLKGQWPLFEWFSRKPKIRGKGWTRHPDDPSERAIDAKLFAVNTTTGVRGGRIIRERQRLHPGGRLNDTPIPRSVRGTNNHERSRYPAAYIVRLNSGSGQKCPD